MAVLRQAQPLQPTSHIPGDWRSRILDALVGEGVAHTAHVPVWRVLCDFFIPAFGALYLFTLFVQISDIPYQLLDSGSFVIAPWGERFWFLVTAPIITCALVVGYIIVKPDFSRSTRQIRIGLPHVAMPGIKLESGRSWPASGLAGAQRRTEQTLAARSSRVLVGDSRARNAA